MTSAAPWWLLASTRPRLSGFAALRTRIDEELSLLVGADWAQVPLVLITGHRRENFGDGIDQICQAIATLAERVP